MAVRRTKRESECLNTIRKRIDALIAQGQSVDEDSLILLGMYWADENPQQNKNGKRSKKEIDEFKKGYDEGIASAKETINAQIDNIIGN